MSPKPLIKKSHRGWLHKNLGVPAGQTLTLAELDKAAKSKSAAVRKRATFAKNARSWNK
jgi:hypothetical protein